MFPAFSETPGDLNPSPGSGRPRTAPSTCPQGPGRGGSHAPKPAHQGLRVGGAGRGRRSGASLCPKSVPTASSSPGPSAERAAGGKEQVREAVSQRKEREEQQPGAGHRGRGRPRGPSELQGPGWVTEWQTAGVWPCPTLSRERDDGRLAAPRLGRDAGWSGGDQRGAGWALGFPSQGAGAGAGAGPPPGVFSTTPHALAGICLPAHTEVTSDGGSEHTVERLVFLLNIFSLFGKGFNGF